MKMKLRARFVIASCLVAVGLFGLLLIETELKMSHRLLEDFEPANGNSHHPVLQRRFLNRDETSKVSGEASHKVSAVIEEPSNNETKPGANTGATTEAAEGSVRDDFEDLYKYSVFNPDFKQYMREPQFVLPKKNPTYGDILRRRSKKPPFRLLQRRVEDSQEKGQTDEVPLEWKTNLTNFEKFHLQISRYSLYPEDTSVVDAMLQDFTNQKVVALQQLSRGTQIKFIMTFEGGGQALFKPMRFPRDHETLPDHFYFTDFERHHSEIASYHLDRLLGFRRAPPVVGRLFNITTEIYALADEDLLKTFFVSPAGNLCFHGQCTYYCDTAHPVCGHPDTVEASLAAWLPPKEDGLERRPVRSPYRRSYNKRRRALWETNDTYCAGVKRMPPYHKGRRLYDLMDLSIFDFLTGNMDRHHYEEILFFGNDSNSAPIHWDHGRGFGKAHHDEVSILQPFLQCCSMRLSTFNKIFAFHNGPDRLSTLMAKAMAQDPVAPILTEAHLEALDRRVAMILQAVRKCLFYNQQRADLIFHDDM